jgi:hypothetical protein
MQTLRTPPNISSAWQKLKNREITCEEALNLLVDEQRVVNLDLLSEEVSARFFRAVPNLQRFTSGYSSSAVAQLLLLR